MFTPAGIEYGLLYSLAAFIGKIVTGIFAKSRVDMLVIGLAMVGRGEVGLLMASQSYQAAKISEEVFSITIWAVILNTVISPFLFNWSLKLKLRLESRVESPQQEEMSTVTTSTSSLVGLDIQSD